MPAFEVVFSISREIKIKTNSPVLSYTTLQKKSNFMGENLRFSLDSNHLLWLRFFILKCLNVEMKIFLKKNHLPHVIAQTIQWLILFDEISSFELLIKREQFFKSRAHVPLCVWWFMKIPFNTYFTGEKNHCLQCDSLDVKNIRQRGNKNRREIDDCISLDHVFVDK